jgi:membrane protease YdiL (CAAX protease family)
MWRIIPILFGDEKEASMNTTLVVNAAISAILQVTLLAGVPFLGYFIYQKWRHKRSFSEIAGRAGLQRCSWQYLACSAALGLAGVVLIVIRPPPLDLFTRQGSAQHQFVGLGLTLTAITLAIINGVVQTAFAEELLFRGLIAGSFSRHLPLVWANLLQALIFLLPHFLILLVMPQMWGILPVVFVGALASGWIRIKSGSIIGPWLMHASVNVTMALSIAIRTAV